MRQADYSSRQTRSAAQGLPQVASVDTTARPAQARAGEADDDGTPRSSRPDIRE
jgi:hypothetical protein